MTAVAAMPSATLPRRSAALPALLLLAAVAEAVAIGAWPHAAAPLEFAAVFLAATVSSVGGFAFSGLCGALLQPLGTDPLQAVRIMLVASIGMQLLGIWALRRELRLRPLLPFLAGGLATLPLGVHLLLTLPPGEYAGVFGALLAAYGACMLARPGRTWACAARLARLGDLLAGAAGGITGGLAAFPAALVVPWCGLRGWPKQRQRAVFQPFILVLQLATLGLLALWAPDAAGSAFPASTLAYLPPALLGTLCGLRVFGSLSDRRFAMVVNLLLIASGVALLT